MKTLSYVLAAGLTLGVASMASAATITTFTPADPEFSVSGNIFNGPISADFGRSGIAAGDYIDRYVFTIPQTGTATGSVTTTTGTLNLPTDLDIDYVTVNGILADNLVNIDYVEFWSVIGVPITYGVENVIEIAFKSYGAGSYGGQATFVPTPVPELGTWAMMLLGVGFAGFAMRRNRRVTTRLSYS